MAHNVKICKNVSIGGGHFALIAGPCVIESESVTFSIASALKEMTDDLGIPFVFKASFDKANRTSITSYRGPGIEVGLDILSDIRSRLSVPVISDLHSLDQVKPAARVLDILQIPAFLCRQTDLLVAAARTGKPLNIKKGQFLAPWDMKHVVAKVRSAGNDQIMLTERGAMFGYNNLVTDFRSIKIMKDLDCPVIFDATHSVQLPGGAGGASGGQREFAPVLARAAIAVGADAIFMEVHPDPDNALSDGPNSIKLDDMSGILKDLVRIAKACGNFRAKEVCT
ncbi:MAG: 3-deoxy-8-phosphooctulonate synthase [Deltaproteobacteria bacterium]|nr:3-deoxy-8-phosphooctulonate synthase [Deltaproteobacteria bacterium]